MDFLQFVDIAFDPQKNTGRLCEDLTDIIGKSLVRYVFTLE
jgi:hypothetical protein